MPRRNGARPTGRRRPRPLEPPKPQPTNYEEMARRLVRAGICSDLMLHHPKNHYARKAT